MTDVLSKEQRSYCMSKIKSSKTKPELKLKKTLKLFGFIYQPKIYGKPDFIHRREKIAVFVDGCFWHKCPKCFKKPKTNGKFWIENINKNVEMDKKFTKKLKKEGWKVITIWEHKLKN